MALTMVQIRNKIDTLARQKNNYDSEKSKYKNSLEHANKLVRSLSNSDNYLNSSADYLKRYFTINSKTVDNGEISKIKNEINNIIKKLNNTIIPNIKNNINTLDTKINNINKEIRELRRQLEVSQV